MFPISRRGNEYAGWLPDRNFEELIKTHGLEYGVTVAYESFFKDLANGRKLDHNVSKYRNHPGGRYTDRYSGNVPFDKLFRYKWLNFIPCNFNTRDVNVDKSKPNCGIPFTLEFRPHNASMNYTKIKNWVLFCLAFVSYVENYPLDVVNQKKISINDIISKVFANKTVIKNNLISYFDSRKKVFSAKDDTIEEKEYSEVVVHNKVTYKEIIS
jgi:hypothetical protein